MKVNLVSITKPVGKFGSMTAEEFLVATARVSNPQNQFNTNTTEKLINYCIKNAHWSIFETVNITFEIETSLVISMQLLRHRSATFQQFSRRYAEGEITDGEGLFEDVELRKQAKSNRQASDWEAFSPYVSLGVTQDLKVSPSIAMEMDADTVVERYLALGEHIYNKLLAQGVSRETARMVLPGALKTRLYMTNNLRNWLFYLKVRDDADHAQKEIVLLSREIKKLLTQEFPITMQVADKTLYKE